jgi:predicted TIM-barrel fold metal-dependent hydrolase
MIIDAHYHLEERMETVDKLLEHMKHHDIGKVVLIPPLNTPFKVDWLAIKSTKPFQRSCNSRWQKLGLLLYKALVTNNGKYRIGGRLYPIYDNPDNDNVARILQAYPDKFSGWITVNPNTADPLLEVEKRTGEPGWIGVKTHPFMYRHPVRMLDRVASYCAEKGWPLLMHLGADRDRGDFCYLPDRHPNLKVIYAHAGLPYFRDLWDYAKEKQNVYIDFSCSLLDTAILAQAVKALGPEKCLYGSDSPYGYPGADGSHDYSRVLNNIMKMPIPDRDKDKILGENFRELAGIQ